MTVIFILLSWSSEHYNLCNLFLDAHAPLDYTQSLLALLYTDLSAVTIADAICHNYDVICVSLKTIIFKDCRIYLHNSYSSVIPPAKQVR